MDLLCEESASSEINELFKGNDHESPENVPDEQTSGTKSQVDTDSEAEAVIEICKQPQHIENDIETTITEFLDEFGPFFSTEVTGNAFITRKLQDKLVKISQWIGGKLQSERDGWANKLKMAMQEIENQRKSALQSSAVIQECCEQLHLLLECFNVSDLLLQRLPKDDLGAALQKEVEILVDVCNIVMEDRFQSLHILGMSEDTTTSLAEVLGSELSKMNEELKKLEVDSAAIQKKLEAENVQLQKEITKMKQLISQKEKDIELFQEQLSEINKIVYGEEMLVKPTNGSANDKTKSQSKTNSSVKQSSQNSQQPKYTSFVKHNKPTIYHLDPIHHSNTNTSKVTTVQSNSDVNSQQTKENKPQNSITAGTQTSVIQAIFPPMIQISEEKLNILKQRARKLEESLHDAITSMEMLRKTAKTNDSISMECNVDLGPVKSSREYKTKRGCLETLDKDWKKATFEVKGAHTASVSSYEVLPKLNKPRDLTKRRCQSEKIAPSSDTCKTPKQTSVHTEEQTDALAKLRAYHRPKNGFGKVSKCFRCQKLFRTTDNHKLACCFHSKGKERAEKYSEDGRLLKVTYIWRCCNQEMDAEGCCTGPHM